MEIITSCDELIRFDCWLDYCEMAGIDPFCMKKDPGCNDRNDEVTLTILEADAIGLLERITCNGNLKKL